MPGDGLKRLFTTFKGDTRAMGFYLKAFGGEAGFAAALKTANWKLGALETAMLARRKADSDVKEKAITDGAAARDKAAKGEADALAKSHSASNAAVKALLTRLIAIRKEIKDRKLDDPAFAPDLSFLDLPAPPKVGDLAAAGVASPVDTLLVQEPVMIVSGKIAELRRDIAAQNAVFDDTWAKRYKDSRKLLTQIEADAAQLADDMKKVYETAAPAARKMDFAEQYMVPQASDLSGVEHTMQNVDGISTPNQAWALEGAEKKGTDELPVNRIAALDRLAELAQKWGVPYGPDDLDPILKYLAAGTLATNYTFDAAPGANTNTSKGEQTKLMDLLMNNDNFKNVWETGASQASDDLGRRGGVEEQMGYSAALNRKGGKEHTVGFAGKKDDADGSKFDPENPDEMPKYAALIDDDQKDGVALRYGKSFVIWKDKVRERVTHTPKDSWGTLGDGVAAFTSNSNPEVLLARGDEALVRLAAAHATGKDKKFAAKVAKEGMSSNDYFETQIHGDLTWADVDTLVIGEDEADTIIAKFQAFKKEKGHDFKVKKK